MGGYTRITKLGPVVATVLKKQSSNSSSPLASTVERTALEAVLLFWADLVVRLMNDCYVSSALDAARSVLRLDAPTGAPSLCVLASRAPMPRRHVGTIHATGTSWRTNSQLADQLSVGEHSQKNPQHQDDHAKEKHVHR